MVELGDQALRDHRRVLEVRIKDEDRKFVATDAHQNVQLPKASDEARPKLPEQFVAGGMSEGVVDLLEVIEVDVEQRQVPVDRFRVREVGEERVEQIEQLPSVAQPGQVVGDGLSEPFLCEEPQAAHRECQLECRRLSGSRSPARPPRA